MAEDKIGFLEDEALKRKKRISLMKKKNEENSANDSESPKHLPKPKFRSYKPQDDTLKENVIEESKPGNVEAEVQDLLSVGKYKVAIENLDISSLAPRKSDWDLKRDVLRKGEKLERRTQKAIAELIIERLKKTDFQDLTLVINMIEDKNLQEKMNE